jgi:transposase
MTRARVRLGWERTRAKCLIHSILAQYGLQMGEEYSDIFSPGASEEMDRRCLQLPECTRYVVGTHRERLETARRQIAEMEKRIRALVRVDDAMRLLDTLPGIGEILAAAVALEIGDIARFPDHEHYAAYAGWTPRVHASGGRVRYGRCRPDVNRTLKWAYSEAGNSVAPNHKRKPELYVSARYRATRGRRNHSVAIGAVARHLAEASYHVLSRKEPYLDPALRRQRSRQGSASDEPSYPAEGAR